MRFGISTHLFHEDRLDPHHLDALAAAGFDLVEIFATRTHVDYLDPATIETVAGWLDARGLEPWSLHLPICDAFTGGRWGRAFSNASPDAARRREAVDETIAAIQAARDLGCRIAVLHLGLPFGQPIPPGDNDAGAVARSLEAIAAAADGTGVRLALEVIPNALSTADALVTWLEDDLALGNAGACLDIGHAHLTGGVPEAIETLAGHLLTTHVHDNRGRADDHLVPFEGTVDWPMTLMALAKVGYVGPLVFELPRRGGVEDVLARAVAARRRIRAILDDLTQPFGFSET